MPIAYCKAIGVKQSIASPLVDHSISNNIVMQYHVTSGALPSVIDWYHGIGGRARPILFINRPGPSALPAGYPAPAGDLVFDQASFFHLIHISLLFTIISLTPTFILSDLSFVQL